MSAERGASDGGYTFIRSGCGHSVGNSRLINLHYVSCCGFLVLGSQKIQGDDVLSLSVKRVGWVLDILKACKDESAQLDRKIEQLKNLHTRICSAHHILNEEMQRKSKENSK